MDFNWKRAVKDAQRHGYASSGRLDGFENIKFYLDGNKLMMTDVEGNAKEVHNMTDLCVYTVHCLPGHTATFTQMNSHDIAVVEEFTRAIMRGEIRIIGSYSCVNNLGNQPLPNAKQITPVVPVPIKLRHGDEFHIRIGKVKVTRGAASWYIHTGHVGSTTTAGEGRTKMEVHRVYMCGDADPPPAVGCVTNAHM